MPVTLDPASAQAQSIADLFWMVLYYMGGILALVTGLVLYASFKFRARSPQDAPRPVFGNMKMELAWTLAPALLLVGIAIPTVRTMYAVEPPPNEKPDLVVTGHQWWWEVYYPNEGIYSANEIRIPVGRRLLVEVRSADVIHDFWVPRLGRKIDAVPDHSNFVWISTDRAGTYSGACAEFCGAQHAWMRLDVVAQDDHAAWVAQQKQPLAQDIPSVFKDKTCANCHNASDNPSGPTIGPDLRHVGGRLRLGGGVLANNPANMRKWLEDPQLYKPESHMPNLRLQDHELDELTRWLGDLQ
jgi:cytochrome c oxidase subunit 2